MKKTTCIILVCVIILAGLASTITVNAANNAMIENNNAITVDRQINQILEKYFELRNNILMHGKTVSEKDFSSIFSEINIPLGVQSKELTRMNARSNLEKYHGVHLIESSNTIYIQSVSTIDNLTYQLEIYEWTWIKYNDGSNGSADYMGYATNHSLILAKKSDGTYHIIDDIYDESDILGKPTQTEHLTSNSSYESSRAISGVNTNADLKVNNVIDYADKWVPHQYSLNTICNYSDYNTPQYGYYSGKDCANFTSQCIKAGGMNFDYGSGKDHTNWDGTQWWFDIAQNSENNDETACPPSWRYVPKFIEYWENQGFSRVSATKTNIFPGNPVINNTSHVGICVGYNASGTPIVNAHTRDVYHVPYTMIGDGTLTTIKLTTSNQMVQSAAGATVIIPTTTNTQVLKYLGSDHNHFYKLTVTTAGYYTFKSTPYSENSLNTKATIYKESETSNGKPLYLYEIKTDDDSGESNNFLIRQHLEPGTYYIRVRATAVGHYYFNYLKG